MGCQRDSRPWEPRTNNLFDFRKLSGAMSHRLNPCAEVENPRQSESLLDTVCRMTLFLNSDAMLKMGVETAIDAPPAAGFDSLGGFRKAFSPLFGTPASEADGAECLLARWLATPLGPMLAVTRDEGIVLLDFFDRNHVEAELQRLCRRFGSGASPAVIVPGTHRHLDHVERELAEYFAGTRQSFTVPLAPRGTDFELKAWTFLRAIPYAQTRSYGQQARGMEMPRAVRSVGRANGRNFMAILIPCHRVIGADGTLTGYGGGLARKQWLLHHESHFALSQKSI